MVLELHIRVLCACGVDQRNRPEHRRRPTILVLDECLELGPPQPVVHLSSSDYGTTFERLRARCDWPAAGRTRWKPVGCKDAKATARLLHGDIFVVPEVSPVQHLLFRSYIPTLLRPTGEH